MAWRRWFCDKILPQIKRLRFTEVLTADLYLITEKNHAKFKDCPYGLGLIINKENYTQ